MRRFSGSNVYALYSHAQTSVSRLVFSNVKYKMYFHRHDVFCSVHYSVHKLRGWENERQYLSLRVRHPRRQQARLHVHVDCNFIPRLNWMQLDQLSVHRSGRWPCGCRVKPNSTMPTSPETSPQGSRRDGIWAKGDVTGLSRTSRGSRHSGIWA